MDAFKKNNYKMVLIIISLTIIFFIIKYAYSDQRIFTPSTDYPRIISLNDNGMAFFVSTKAQIVSDFLTDQNITLSEFDEIIPAVDTPLFPGSQIEIRRALKVSFAVDGKNISGFALTRNIRDTIAENNILLGRLDQTVPDLDSLTRDNLKIVITRINVEEKIIPEEINFKTIEKTDAKLSWREKKVEQKGEKGIKEVKYKITYKNGKEISRVVLEKKITQEPVAEIVIQGTYVKIGKTHKGLGTWYAWKGGLFAASPWLPMGSYARVINQTNGKSVIVQINDRGPFGPNRIIDLDKVAFAKIASIGAGVIEVKVEEIIN